MKKTLSPEQAARRAERKEKFAAIVKKVADMSEAERDALAARIEVVNVDGHTLSRRNQLLIALQLGCNSTIVGGFRQWIKQGRCVRKGQHGASILFPRHPAEKAMNDAARDQEHTVEGKLMFLSGTVFDISQTDEIKDQTTETQNEAIVEHCGDLLPA